MMKWFQHFPEWCQEYNSNFSNPTEMQKEIDEFMSKYDKELRNEEKLKKQNAEPDDCGWVTVTKKLVLLIYIWNSR